MGEEGGRIKGGRFYSAKGEVRIRIIEIISVVHGKTHLGFENSV